MWHWSWHRAADGVPLRRRAATTACRWLKVSTHCRSVRALSEDSSFKLSEALLRES